MAHFLSFLVLVIGAQTLFLPESVITTETDRRDYSFSFERLDHFPTENINAIDIGTLRVRRRKQTTFIEGNFSLLNDLDNSFSIEILTEYSPRGNSLFLKYPFHVRKIQVCDFIAKVFGVYLIEGLMEENSNLGLECPIVKGNYWYKNISDFINTPQHLPYGLWRATMTLYNNNSTITDRVQFYTRVLSKY